MPREGSGGSILDDPEDDEKRPIFRVIDGVTYRWDNRQQKFVPVQVDAPPRASAAVRRASQRVIDGTYDEADVIALRGAREITAAEAATLLNALARRRRGFGADPGGGGGGTALAQLAQRAREFEWQKQFEEQRFAHQQELDRQAAQARIMDHLSMLAQQADQRGQMARENMLAAAPWLVPEGMTHYPGFGPESLGVRAGFIDAVPTNPMPFNPYPAENPYDERVESALDQLARMAGVA